MNMKQYQDIQDFIASHSTVMMEAQKQASKVKADIVHIEQITVSCDVTYPAPRIAAQIGILYGHILDLYITVRHLENLLMHADKEISEKAWFMDDYITVLHKGNDFLKKTEFDFYKWVGK